MLPPHGGAGSAQSRLTRLRRVTPVDDVEEGAPITGLSHVQLLVSDVRASAKWYSAVLGLVPYADDADIGYVALRHKAGNFRRGADRGAAARRAGRGGARRPGPFGPRRARRHPTGGMGPTPTDIGIDHAGVVPEGGHPSLQLRDPDGIAIELVAT